MSYAGPNIPVEGPFLQGLTTSSLQDTWSSTLVSYASSNNVATLDSGYKGDWRLSPSFSTGSDTAGRLESRRPFSSAASHYAYHGNITNWNAGYRIAGDESLVAPSSTYCGYYLHTVASGNGALNIVPAGCTTICELVL